AVENPQSRGIPLSVSRICSPCSKPHPVNQSTPATDIAIDTHDPPLARRVCAPPVTKSGAPEVVLSRPETTIEAERAYQPSTDSMAEAARRSRAACIICCCSKIKCHWARGEARCMQCIQLERDCVRRDVHLG